MTGCLMLEMMLLEVLVFVQVVNLVDDFLLTLHNF